MWGRLSTCGGLVTRLQSAGKQPARTLTSCPTMSMNKPTVVALAILLAAAAAAAQQSPLTLWYNQPAVLWTDALPVGNGQMGAMIFGGAVHERIQFNQHTRSEERRVGKECRSRWSRYH